MCGLITHDSGSCVLENGVPRNSSSSDDDNGDDAHNHATNLGGVHIEEINETEHGAANNHINNGVMETEEDPEEEQDKNYADTNDVHDQEKTNDENDGAYNDHNNYVMEAEDQDKETDEDETSSDYASEAANDDALFDNPVGDVDQIKENIILIGSSTNTCTTNMMGETSHASYIIYEKECDKQLMDKAHLAVEKVKPEDVLKEHVHLTNHDDKDKDKVMELGEILSPIRKRKLAIDDMTSTSRKQRVKFDDGNNKTPIINEEEQELEAVKIDSLTEATAVSIDAELRTRSNLSQATTQQLKTDQVMTSGQFAFTNHKKKVGAHGTASSSRQHSQVVDAVSKDNIAKIQVSVVPKPPEEP